MHPIHKTHITQAYHVLNSFHTLKHFVANLNLFILHNLQTIDYDAHINTKIDHTINHVFRSLTVQELNALHTICELERIQLLTILAMSVQNSSTCRIPPNW